MKLIKSELGTIRQSQEEQQTEREQVLEGLKAVEAVVKKLDRIEAVQETHEQRISTHDEEIKTNSLKREEGEKRIKKLEDQVRNIDPQTFDLRQCNAVAKEVREIEKRVKNVVFFNVPEAAGEEEENEEAQKKADREKVRDILKEMDLEDIWPSNVTRTGKTGRHPKQILTTLKTTEDCERVMKK